MLNGRRLAGRYGETLASATLEAYSHLIGLPYGQGLLISVTSFGDDMSYKVHNFLLLLLLLLKHLMISYGSHGNGIYSMSWLQYNIVLGLG